MYVGYIYIYMDINYCLSCSLYMYQSRRSGLKSSVVSECDT